VGKTNKVSVGKTARKTTNHVDERNSAGHVQGPMVHLISKLRKAAEDRFGSFPATQGDGPECPNLLKAVIQHGRTECQGFAISGHRRFAGPT
jgi:hypothetical protein